MPIAAPKSVRSANTLTNPPDADRSSKSGTNGSTLTKRYGEGLVLNFIDQYENMPVGLYVSQDLLAKSPHAARILRMVDEVEKNKTDKPYLRVFWIGGLEKSETNDNRYKASISSLALLAMRLVYPKRQEVESPTS